MLKFVFLTNKFYDDYANCGEIEKKPLRPYVKVLIEIGDNLYAIPLRSNINHCHVLWTDKENKCGLDFSKTVVITNPDDYIVKENEPHIRQNEFDSLRGKEYIIKQKLIKYIKDYKKAKNRIDVPRNKNLVEYSTMQYFEEYI